MSGADEVDHAFERRIRARYLTEAVRLQVDAICDAWPEEMPWNEFARKWDAEYLLRRGEIGRGASFGWVWRLDPEDPNADPHTGRHTPQCGCGQCEAFRKSTRAADGSYQYDRENRVDGDAWVWRRMLPGSAFSGKRHR